VNAQSSLESGIYESDFVERNIEVQISSFNTRLGLQKRRSVNEGLDTLYATKETSDCFSRDKWEKDFARIAQ